MDLDDSIRDEQPPFIEYRKNYKLLESFVKETLGERGESHGLKHAQYVRNLALYITETEFFHLSDNNKDIIEAAAMLHDICDHKYKNKANRANVEYSLKSFLSSIFTENDKNTILEIIKEVSYSREVKNKNWNNLDEEVKTMRHIVSDSDKIEALGGVGLKRCFEFQNEEFHIKNKTRQIQEVVAHCEEKLLHLYSNFIHTQTGKKIAKPRHEFLNNWYIEAKSFIDKKFL